MSNKCATLPLPGGEKGPRDIRGWCLLATGMFSSFSFLFSLFSLLTKFLDVVTTTHYHVHHQLHISKLTTTERHRVVNTRLLPTPETMLPTSMKWAAAAARGLGRDTSRAPGMYVYIYINIITTNEFIMDTTTHYLNKLTTTEQHRVVSTRLLPTPETTLPTSMKRAAAAPMSGKTHTMTRCIGSIVLSKSPSDWILFRIVSEAHPSLS